MSEVVSPRHSVASRFAIRFMETYRTGVSGRLHSECRFQPSCSCFGLEAYRRYGFWRATCKTLGRLSRCRSGHEGPRFDPT